MRVRLSRACLEVAVGFRFNKCSQGQSGGGALDGFREQRETVSSSVRTRTIRLRVAQTWLSEAIVRDVSEGRQLSEKEVHDQAEPTGRSRARPNAAGSSIVIADRGNAIRLRGAPSRVGTSTGSGLD